MPAPKLLLILLSAAGVSAWLLWRGNPLAALAVLAFLLIPWVLYDLWRMRQLEWWLALPERRDLPTAPGSWGRLFTRMNLLAQRSESELRDIRREMNYVYKAVDELPEGVIVLDRFQHVLWSNRTARAVLGIFGDRKPIHHFLRDPALLDMLDRGAEVPVADHPRADAPVADRLRANSMGADRPPWDALGANSSETNQPPSQAEDREETATSHIASICGLPDAGGRIYEFRLHQSGTGEQLLVFRDTTDASRLDAMRRDFVANVSHEIRTPITVIGGFAETMLSIPCSPDQTQGYLQEILRQSATMRRLVEDLLTLSSLENAMAPPKGEAIAIHALLQGMCDEARVISGGRHQVSIDLQGPASLEAASGEIESAIRNLVTNAIRYTPEGGHLRISWRVRDLEGWISVSDNGIGISPEHLPRLTERFYRVDRGRSRAAGGTGLGLAIVKHVMHRHQGRIDVQSQPGKGSQFSLVFPATRVRPLSQVCEKVEA
jgi:two-component system phosphate regulon sensor histidine kinase PhoR